MQECKNAETSRCAVRILAFLHFYEVTRCNVSRLTSIFIFCFAFTM